MSVNIRFYQVDDPINKVNKTLPSEFLQCDCVFRYPCDSRNPVLTIDLNNVQDELGVDDPQKSGVFVYRNYNYASIEFYSGTGRRFYFVQQTKVINNTMVEVSLKIDPLKTYSSEIGNVSLYVERNQYAFADILEDRMMPFGNEKKTTNLNLDTNSGTIDFGIASLDQSLRFVAVTCLVKSETLTSTTYGLATYLANHYTTDFPTVADATNYLMTRTDIVAPNSLVFPASVVAGMRTFNPAMVKGGYAIITYIIGLERLSKLMDLVYSHDEKLSYVLGVTAIPISGAFNFVNYDNYDVPLYIGDDDPSATLLSGAWIATSGQMSKYIVHRIWDKTSESSDFKKYEPYSNYELFIPYYGFVSLPSHNFIGHKGALIYQIDLVTGEATAFVRDDVSHSAIISVKCQVGMPIPLNATNYHEIENARRTNNISTAFGLISSLATIGIGVATANPVAVGMGVLGASSAVVKGANSNLNLIQRGNVQYTQADAPNYDYLVAFVRKTYQPTYVTDMLAYRAGFGSPLQEVMQLSSLTGLTICGGDIIGQLGAIHSPLDQEEIASFLRSGVIL